MSRRKVKIDGRWRPKFTKSGKLIDYANQPPKNPNRKLHSVEGNIFIKPDVRKRKK